MMIYRVSVIVLVLLMSSCSAVSLTDLAVRSSQAPLATITETTHPPLLRNTASPAFSATPDLTGTVYVGDNLTASAAEQTLVAQYLSPCDLLHAARDFSPNREWMVELCTNTNDANLMLAFSHKQSNTKWKFFFEDFIPPTLQSPDGGMSVIHWSKDGRYAYFRSYIASDGGECFRTLYDDGVGLFRVDLQNGDLTTLLPVRHSFAWYSFTFSPTDRRLVYGDRGRDLQILDLKTGALLDVRSSKPFSHADAYSWSSDGLALVYSTVLYGEAGTTLEYSLRWLDAESGEEQILLKSEQDCLRVQGWKDKNVLIIESFDQDRNLTVIEYDLLSKQVLSENTATPFP